MQAAEEEAGGGKRECEEMPGLDCESDRSLNAVCHHPLAQVPPKGQFREAHLQLYSLLHPIITAYPKWRDRLLPPFDPAYGSR